MTATEADHAAAVKALLVAALGQPWPVFEVGDDLGGAEDYLEFTLVRRYGGVSRMSGQKGTVAWRLLTRYVSRSYLANARAMRSLACAALEDARLVVDGETSTPVEFESGVPVGPDEGWLSGYDSWTWAIAAA